MKSLVSRDSPKPTTTDRSRPCHERLPKHRTEPEWRRLPCRDRRPVLPLLRANARPEKRGQSLLWPWCPVKFSAPTCPPALLTGGRECWRRCRWSQEFFFRPGFQYAAQPIAQTMENLTDCLSRRDHRTEFLVLQQFVPHGSRRDSREGQSRLKLGVGLRLGLDHASDFLGQLRSLLFGLVAASCLEIVEAADSSSFLVQTGVDRRAAPTKHRFRLSSGAATILESHLCHELSPVKPCQLSSRQLDRLDQLIRERVFHNLLHETAWEINARLVT